jgi:spore germination protein KC
MKNIIVLSIIALLSLTVLTSCWNYREIDKIAVVAGVAIDKTSDNQYLVTAEIIQLQGGGTDVKSTSTRITMKGKTIFDAVRNEISLSGKKLFWSHTKVVIISEKIAEDGMIRILDWLNRDSETRAEIDILVSKEKTAREIFNSKPVTDPILSFELDEMLKNQISLSKAPVTEIWKVINDFEMPGIVAVLPVVKLSRQDDHRNAQIMGTAIFKKDKLVGYLNGEQTKDMLFVKDEVEGGLIIAGGQGNIIPKPISLEIFKNKTKLKSVSKGNDVKININIETSVGIDEIEGSKNYMNAEFNKKMEKKIERDLKIRVVKIIKHVQEEYAVDIFGFGAKIREDKPRLWNRIESNWENEFKNLPVTVSTKVNIQGSGMQAEPIERGD